MTIAPKYGDYTILNPVGDPSYTQVGRQATYTIAFLLQSSSDSGLLALETAARSAINKNNQKLTVKKGLSTNYTFAVADKTAIEISGKFDRLESVGFTYLCRASFTIELPSDVLGIAATGKTPYAAGMSDLTVDLRFTTSELMNAEFTGVYTAASGTDAETNYANATSGAKAVAELWLTDFGGDWELQPEVKNYNETDTRINFSLSYQQRLVVKGASGDSYKWRSIRIVKDAGKISIATAPEYAFLQGKQSGPIPVAEATFNYNIHAIVDVLVSKKTYTSKELEDLFDDDIRGTLLTILGDTFESDAQINTKRIECDPVQNTIVVSMTLKQSTSAGIYTLRYKESLTFESMSRILKKPDSLSHTADIFEPGAEIHMTQIISATTEKPINLWSGNFMPGKIWAPGTPGWKLMRAQDDLEDEVFPEDDEGAITFTQFMTRTFIWLSSDVQARQAPQTDMPSAATGRLSI